MTAEIDITRQLKLPVFDPEFNRTGRVDSRSQNVRKLPPPRPLRIDDPEPRQPPPGILRSQTSSPATPTSPSGSVTSSWTSSSTTSTLTPSILSTSSTTAPSKRTVSFPDNDEYQAQNQLPQMSKRNGNRNRRSTSRGSQVDESNNRTAAAAAAPSTGSRDDERRIKRAPIRKWKSLSAVDSQQQQQQQHDQVPVGVRARLQRLRCQSEVDVDSRQTRAAPQSSTSPSKTKASDAEACRYRPSNYARFKYPVKYHRVAEPGQPDLRSRSLLVTATFQMPPCFRRPTPSYWMPVRQGQTSDDGPTGQRQRTANKQESAKTKQENWESKTKQRSGGKTDKTRGSLNGVYHVVHGDQTAGDLNRPGSRAESWSGSRAESEPQTAVEQVRIFSEYGSSLPSGDESDEDRYDSDVTKDVNRSKFRGKPPAVSDSGTAEDSLVIARRSESDNDDSDDNKDDSQEDAENYRDDFDLAADEDDADDHSSSDEK